MAVLPRDYGVFTVFLKLDISGYLDKSFYGDFVPEKR